MNVDEIKKAKTLVMTPEGRLDQVAAQSFQQKVINSIENGESSILIDFSKINYISSAGLRTLLIIAKRQKDSDGLFAICSLTDNVNQVFKASGFDTIVDIYPDQKSALDKLL